jgi:hypothetical protein
MCRRTKKDKRRKKNEKWITTEMKKTMEKTRNYCNLSCYPRICPKIKTLLAWVWKYYSPHVRRLPVINPITMPLMRCSNYCDKSVRPYSITIRGKPWMVRAQLLCAEPWHKRMNLLYLLKQEKKARRGRAVHLISDVNATEIMGI